MKISLPNSTALRKVEQWFNGTKLAAARDHKLIVESFDQQLTLHSSARRRSA
jgi:hypothetical protein